MKLTFDDVMQRLNEERSVSRDEVKARDLQRFVWVAEWHLPGCLSESFCILLTKRDAVEEALSMLGDEVRGAKTDLMRYGRTDRTSPNAWATSAITTIERQRVRDLF